MSQDETYVASFTLPVAVEDAFAYHDRPGALDRLIPPWENAKVERSDGSLAVGSRVVLKTWLFGVPIRWTAEHTLYEPPKMFADTQVSGPFAKWDHQHIFDAAGDEQCVIQDRISYRLPMGFVGKLFGGGMARRTIESMFAYRHHVTRYDLELMAHYQQEPLTVAVSGSTGLVGSSLSAMLTLLGHQTKAIVRSQTGNENEIAAWGNESESTKFHGVDAVVHLAGKSIASGRWTDEIKQEIRDSRVIKTRQLCERLAALECKPRVLVCASATGIYGDRSDEVLTEESKSGNDFLSRVAAEWEEACQPAIDAGIRVVNARLGLVLSPKGGALQKMLLPAKFAGGSLGNGKQWWSWIALDDVLGGIYHAIQTSDLQGPVNFVSPDPIQNRDFANVLGRVVSRPAIFPAPAFALRAVLGEMANALLLSSTRAEPTRLQSTNYKYRFTDLETTLRYYLGRDRLESAE
ncbi:MAG: TIGR01777 family oxidoreductase [Pirellulaceae bacterium]